MGGGPKLSEAMAPAGNAKVLSAQPIRRKLARTMKGVRAAHVADNAGGEGGRHCVLIVSQCSVPVFRPCFGAPVV